MPADHEGDGVPEPQTQAKEPTNRNKRLSALTLRGKTKINKQTNKKRTNERKKTKANKQMNKAKPNKQMNKAKLMEPLN